MKSIIIIALCCFLSSCYNKQEAHIINHKIGYIDHIPEEIKNFGELRNIKIKKDKQGKYYIYDPKNKNRSHYIKEEIDMGEKWYCLFNGIAK